MSASRWVAPARRSLLASSTSLSTPTISRAPARWADSTPPSVAVTAATSRTPPIPSRSTAERMRSGQGKPRATSSAHNTRSARRPQSSRSTTRLVAGLDREGLRQILMPAAESLASATLRPGSGSTPNRSAAARNDRSKAWLAAWARISSSGKRVRMTSPGGQPRVRSNCTIDLTYAAVPTTTPWVAIASANARSMMLPSTAAAPTTSQQTSDTGDVSLTCLPPCAGSAFAGCRTWLRPRGAVLVGGGGLGPQVEFGTVGLDLAPDGERAKPERGEHDELLHSEEPFTSMTSERAGGSEFRPPQVDGSLAKPPRQLARPAGAPHRPEGPGFTCRG